MNKALVKALILLSGLTALALFLLFWQTRDSPTSPTLTSSSSDFLGSSGESAAGFARAVGPRSLQFPADHGAHPDFQTEWWYFTGNLEAPQGQLFGYQLTFFRRRLLPPDRQVERASGWGAEQVYMAHFALTDVRASQFQAGERFARGAAGLAGASEQPFQVWLQDWRVEQIGPDLYRLSVNDKDVAIRLELADRKGPILQGDRGYSQKGPDPGNASYYYSLTHLETNGEIQMGSGQFTVTGLSWMDHEYSTSALSAGLAGWDWFSIQLNDGTEVMFYQFRNSDGAAGLYSSGAYIEPDGEIQPFSLQDVDLSALSHWASPHSKAVYPSGWQLNVPKLGLSLEIAPYVKDQELNLSFTYWEGAVQVSGSLNGRPLNGSGYVELTGYAGSLSGKF